MRRLLVLAVMAGAVVACGKSEPTVAPGVTVPVEVSFVAPTTNPVRACSELRDGDPTPAAKQLSAPCRDIDGQVHVYSATSTVCDDRTRVLVWNDYGWGFVGEPFHVHAKGAEKVAPADARDACRNAK